MAERAEQKPVPKMPNRRVRTPTLLQMEAVECGAAALGIVLAHFGLRKTLEELRVECGVSRDGSKASNLVKAARRYGLEAKGFRMEPTQLFDLDLPFIVFWNFNHFLVVEGFRNGRVYLNDPAEGPRWVSWRDFDESFTGVVLTFKKGTQFKPGGSKKSLLGMLNRRLAGARLPLLFVVLASAGLILPGLALPVFIKVFVDRVLVADAHDWLRPLLLGMFIALVLRAALTWLQQRYLLRLETRIAVTSSARFLWHVLRLPIAFFTQRSPGEISGRVRLNDQVAQLLSGQLATACLNLISVVFFAVLMWLYDPVLTSVGIGCAALNGLFLKMTLRRRADANMKLLQETGKLYGTGMSGLEMIETIKAGAGESDFFSKWAGYQAKVVNAQQQLGVSVQLMSVVPVTLQTLTTAVILGLGGLRVMEGDLSIGMLVAYQSLMASFLLPINQLVEMGGSLQDAQGDMNRIEDVLNYPLAEEFREEEERGKTGATEDASDGTNGDGHAAGGAADRPGDRLSGEIELRDVTFGYSRLEPALIENFNVRLTPGARVALVGGSGSGKSTIGRLVAGLYSPWEGRILFDGVPRERVPRETLVNSLAIVSQEVFLFEGTIRENLTLWDDTIPEERIVQAARDACVHEIIVARPEGYDSPVEVGGVNFSGGQRQRLEIARALVTNAPILVLDEATSALDPVTERIVDENLRRRGCTCLIVAHRLSTIRDADEIIVLDHGKVVQRGTHEEMKRADGPYARLIATG